MNIEVVATRGEGATQLAAFDAALLSAGIGNYNLLPLSSIIPAGSHVQKVSRAMSAGAWGDRVYVVIAHQFASQPGQEAWAGLGWLQEPTHGRGFFVEQQAANAGTVQIGIDQTIKDMSQNRSFNLGAPESLVTGVVCQQQPVCALVVAVYQTQGWSA